MRENRQSGLGGKGRGETRLLPTSGEAAAAAVVGVGDAGGEIVVVVHGREVAGGVVGVVGGDAARPGAGGEASGGGIGVGRPLAVGVLFGEEEAALGGVVPGGEGGPGVTGEVAPVFMVFMRPAWS